MLLDEINHWKLSDIESVVRKFNLGEVFEKEYGVPVSEYKCEDIGEGDIVDDLLSNIPDRLFYCTFIEYPPYVGEGCYYIVEFPCPECQEKLTKTQYVYQNCLGGIPDKPVISPNKEEIQNLMQADAEALKVKWPEYYDDSVTIEDDGTITFIEISDKEESRYWEIETVD